MNQQKFEIELTGTAEEMAAVVTHVAFYAGWPKAWATFNLCKKVYSDDVEE